MASSQTPPPQPRAANGAGTPPPNPAGASPSDGGFNLPTDSPFTGETPGGPQKTFSQIMGEMVWVMSQSPTHKSFFLSDLEWMIMAPIVLTQFRIFYDPQKPIGFAVWAFVNEEVEKRLTEGGARLKPQDWKCGPRLWLVDLIAPFGGLEQPKLRDGMLIDLKKHVFPNAELHMRVIEENKITIRKL